MTAEINIIETGKKIVLRDGEYKEFGDTLILASRDGTWVGSRRDQLLEYWGKVRHEPKGLKLCDETSAVWLNLDQGLAPIIIENRPL